MYIEYHFVCIHILIVIFTSKNFQNCNIFYIFEVFYLCITMWFDLTICTHQLHVLYTCDRCTIWIANAVHDIEKTYYTCTLEIFYFRLIISGTVELCLAIIYILIHIYTFYRCIEYHLVCLYIFRVITSVKYFSTFVYICRCFNSAPLCNFISLYSPINYTYSRYMIGV